jgi:hypothetical protein
MSNAEIRVTGAQTSSVTRTSEGVERLVRALRDGTLVTAQWIDALILEGLGFVSFEGAFSTPAVGGGAAAIIDIDRPNVTVGIPDGTTILPFRVHGQGLTPLLATDADESEILFGVHVGTKITVVAATEVKPRSLKTGLQQGSVCDFQITHTTNISTAPTVDIELARAIVVGDLNGTPANALWGHLECLYEPKHIPYIKGPSTLLVYRGGTVATTGFTQVYWIELPTSLLS